jgi:hypothetical protein
MSTEQTAVPHPPTPLADDEWTQDHEELPPRPRRRLLGTGGNPVSVALLGVLLLACGFIGGVLVEKGQTSSTTGGAPAGLASRLAALRGTGTNTSSSSAGTAGGGFARRFAGAAPGGATVGEVAYISGNTLYVSGTEGNTVKVTTSPASSITKTVKSDVHGIHPGETVIVRGTKSASGAVSAESISVSAAGAAGGIGALFGAGAGASARGSTGAGGGGAGGGGSSSGEPALFGK